MTQAVEVGEPGWYLYRFYAPTTVRCAVDGCTLRHPLYIGKSNEPWRREKEHARKKPWYRLALLPGGGWMLDERTFPTDRAVRAAETDAIREELPLANEDGNEGNEHRLLFADEPGMPRKVARRAAAARAAVAAPRLAPAVKWVARSHAARVVAAWLALAALLWTLASRAGWSQVGGPEHAAAGAAGLLLGLWAFVERDSRRGKVRFWRACSLLAVAAVVGFLVWPWIGPHLAGFRQAVAR